MAQLLFGRPIWTFVAGLLLALEHLSVVLSRLALLDVHLQLWIVAGFLCLVLDRRWIDLRTRAGPTSDDGAVLSPLWRPWRYAAGFAFGAAVSVKWSGGLGMVAAIVISLMWETTRRAHRATAPAVARSDGRCSRRASPSWSRSCSSRSIVYVVAYLPWLHHFHWQVGELVETQVRIAKCHLFELQTAGRGPRDRCAHADPLRVLATVDVARDDETGPDHVAGHRPVDPAAPRDRQPDRVLGGASGRCRTWGSRGGGSGTGSRGSS